jgi:tetratricopeptide (TPR) repeat protein
VEWLQEVERATGRIGPAAGGDDGDEEGALAGAGDGDGGGAFFAAEDDFFDLAAELEDELSREGELAHDELLLAQPREQTLEEIVEGFKRGVSEALSPEDYATHYDLGIAYREMGLLDEAIGEFQIAAKDPALLVSCCSMLGLSFLEKGLPELAVKWYRRGLAVPSATEEEQLGLLYDLGNAHLATDDRDSAYRAFVDLYGINSHYRDVVARLEDTRPRE